jgi:hypothetical protein
VRTRGARTLERLESKRTQATCEARAPRQLALFGLVALGALALMATASSGAPTVTILSPLEGASIGSGTVELSLNITNITMNGSAIGQAPVAGEGHYHIYLDNNWLGAFYLMQAYIPNVPQGAHAIRIEIAQNDHSEIGANDSVNITVQSGAPRVLITDPAASSAWGSSSAELGVLVGNFTLNGAAIGGANVAGEGHFAVSVNGALVVSLTALRFNVSGLRIGALNVIRVELVNNDGSALATPAYDELRLTPATSGVPEFNIAASLNGAVVNASSLAVLFTLSNFTLDSASIGLAPVAGHGHYRVLLDGGDLGPGADAPARLADLAPGPHTVALELANNDFTPLAPRVVSWVQFSVAALAPRITITSPPDPANVNASSVELSISVGNFTLAGAKIGQAAAVGEGHYHLFVDGIYLSYGADTQVLVSDLSEGPHTVMVELHQNDHSNLTWPAFDFVRVVVVRGAPKVTILSPAGGDHVDSSSVDLTFVIANFTLDPSAIGLPPVAGRGHWHLFVDGVYRGLGTSLTATATRLMPGTHAIVVELYNNDHTDLIWAAFDQVTVTVNAGSPSVTILDPTPSTALPLNFTVLRVAAQNFSVVDKPDQTPVAGEGHWHIFVDGAFYGMAYTTSAVVEGLLAGQHTVRVVLVGNNHVFVSPNVVDEVTITVVGKRPEIHIASPVSGTVLYGDTADLAVTLANFTLAPGAIGQAPVMGEGHYHIFVDGAYLTFTASTSYTLTGLSIGSHNVTVVLYNNDHSPLAIRVAATTVLQVEGDPHLTISAPANGTVSSLSTVTLTVAVSNFTLEAVPTTAIANVPGHGHYHIWVDGIFSSMATGPEATIANLPLGAHVIQLFLVNNDHSAVGTANSTATVIVTIVAPTAPAKGFLPGFDLAEAVAAVGAAAAFAAFSRGRKPH